MKAAQDTHQTPCVKKMNKIEELICVTCRKNAMESIYMPLLHAKALCLMC